MSVKWTKEQLEAIGKRPVSTLVSAAAGSGKTAVLVERVVRITKEVPVDSLLIVTFTKDAASQMRRKISEKFSEIVSSPDTDEKTRENYRNQLLLLPNADICTIDSFCSKLIKENFEKLSISSNYATISENEALPVFDEVLDSVIDELYENDSKDILILSEAFLDYRNDKKLKNIISSVYKYAVKSPFPDEALDRLLEPYNTDDIEKLDFVKENIKSVQKHLSSLTEFYEQNTSYFIDVNLNFVNCTTCIQNDISTLKEILSAKSYNELYLRLNTAKFQNLPKAEKGLDDYDYEKFKVLRKRCKDGVLKAKKIIDLSPEQLKTFLSLQKPIAEALIKIVKIFSKEYENVQATRNILEFSDLSHYAIKLLTDENKKPTDLAKELSEKYNEIIIDEYQDTNDTQELILSSVSRNNNNVFMVGDIKQSIYKFRNTAPELFNTKVKKLSENDELPGRKIFLNKNFRSRKNILDFTNLIFSQTMCEETGEIDYNENEKLNCGAHYEGNDPSVDVIYLKKGAFPGMTDVEAEAYQTAYTISKMVYEHFQVTDSSTGEMRNVRYCDFAILLRNVKNTDSVFTYILSEYDIPVYTDNNSLTLLNSTEIRILLNWLKIIDNPYQDIPLVSVLKSFMFNFDENFLVKIRKSTTCKSFYDSLAAYNGTSEENEKIAEFLTYLYQFSKITKTSKVYEIIDGIDDKYNYCSYILSMPGGNQRYSNYKYLRNIAENFEDGEFKGLFKFLSNIENIVSSNSSIEGPKILPDDIDVVTVTSIHKSKGLEYPIVIIPTLGREVYKDYENKLDVRIHKNVGMGIDYTNFEQNYTINSPVKRAVAFTNHKEEFAEEMRVLYVALTRAKEKLILMGSIKDFESYIEKVNITEFFTENLIPSNIVTVYTSNLELITSALFRTYAFNSERETAFEITTDCNIKIEYIEEPEEIYVSEIKPEKDTASDTCLEEISEIMEFNYPVDNSDRFLKYTVSELKSENYDTDDSFSQYSNNVELDDFDESEEFSQNAGTVFHFFMEKIDYKTQNTAEKLEELKNRLISDGILTQNEGKYIDTDKVMQFINSTIGKLLQKSDEIYKERSFNILTDSVFENQTEKIQLQGVIDCYFKSGSEYFIIDFKTDKKFNDETFKSYQKQLMFYCEAVKAIHSTDKIRAYIYYLNLNKCCELTVIPPKISD